MERERAAAAGTSVPSWRDPGSCAAAREDLEHVGVIPENGARPVVVAAVDGTRGSEDALDYAVGECRRSGARLRLVHVRPTLPSLSPRPPTAPETLSGVGTEILEKARQRVRQRGPALDVTTILDVGSRVDGVVHACQDAALVVLGRRPATHDLHLPVGGAGLSIAQRVACRVAVVPQQSDAVPGGPVVIGVKDRRRAAAALGLGLDLAERDGNPVVVVHAWALDDPYQDRIESRTHAQDRAHQMPEVLAAVLEEERSRHLEVPVEVRVQHGVAARVLLEASRGAAHVVLSRRAHPGRAGHLGTTARALLQHGTVPVHLTALRERPELDGGEPESHAEVIDVG